NKSIKTMMIAIDGVPSKGKMIEQRSRRYLGSVAENYKHLLLKKYDNYLKQLPNNKYYSSTYEVKWSKNNITPGTGFMDKLVAYLRSESITNKLKINRQQMKIIITDVHEIGEAEKKIVNYVEKYL